MNAYISDMRAMRLRLKAALKRGLVAVLDVGTAKTVCFILKVDPAALDQAMGQGAQHAAFGAMRVVGAGVTQSRGVRLGEINDLEEAHSHRTGAGRKNGRRPGRSGDRLPKRSAAPKLFFFW
jgi:cell division protein FtsA